MSREFINCLSWLELFQIILRIQYTFGRETQNQNHNSNFILQPSKMDSIQSLTITSENFAQVVGCQEFYGGKCLHCYQGWQLDVLTEVCKPICDDKILTFEDQCDIEHDRCFQCKFSFPVNCQQCINNKNFNENSQIIFSQPKYQIISFDCQIECLVCQTQLCYQCWEGWSLINNECIQICGDGLLAINSIEQCDDGNFEFGDGCYNCQIEWCSYYCIDCQLTTPSPKCNQCQEYFEIVGETDCQPICGDEYVVEELEDCDDGNQSRFDGCFNCHYLCPDYCCNCLKGKCQDSCYYGVCYQNYGSMCFNQLRASVACQYFDDNFFKECYYSIGECQVDVINYIFYRKCQCLFDQDDDQCYDICGNGIVERTEECDDGNILNHDGCSSKCQFEFLNSRGIFNEIVNAPKILLTYEKKFLNMQYVDLSFSKPVYLEHGSATLEDSIEYKLTLDGQVLQNVNFFLKPIVEIITDELRFPKYQIQIQFFEYPLNNPNLEIRFNYDISITDCDQRVFFNFESANIELKPLSQNLIQAAQRCKIIGNILIITLGITSLCILLFGKFTDFFEILDVLQYQSFLRYVNITQPENLMYFFESFDSVTLSPLLSNLRLFSLFNITIGYYYMDSIGQFLQHGYNADLLSNIFGQLSQIIGLIFLIICLIYYQKYFYKHCFSNEHFKTLKEKNSQCLKYIAYGFYYINKLFFKIAKLMSRSGCRELFLANVWDLTLKVLLFLASNKNFSLRDVVSYAVSALYLTLLTIFLLTHISKEQSYASRGEFLEQSYEALVVSKKFLFLLILILLQYDSILQSILLASIIIAFICILCSIHMIESNLNKIIIIWIEFPILTFTIISLFYCKELEEFTNDDQKIILAFIQISSLILGMLAPIVKHFVIFTQKIKAHYNRKKQQQSSIRTQNILTVG